MSCALVDRALDLGPGRRQGVGEGEVDVDPRQPGRRLDLAGRRPLFGGGVEGGHLELGDEQREALLLAGHVAEHAGPSAVEVDLRRGAGQQPGQVVGRPGLQPLAGDERQLFEHALEVEQVDVDPVLPRGAQGAAGDQRQALALDHGAVPGWSGPAEGMPELEQADRLDAAAGVVAGAGHQAGQQRAAHHRVELGQRVGQPDRLLVGGRLAQGRQARRLLGGVERPVDRLGEAAAGELAAQPPAELLARRRRRVRLAQVRQGRGDRVEAVDPQDLLVEVGGLFEVEQAPGGNGDGEDAARPPVASCSTVQPRPRQPLVRLAGRDLDAAEGVQAVEVEGDGPGLPPRVVLRRDRVDHAGEDRSAAQVGDQGGRPGRRARLELRVRAALEAMGGVRVHPQALGGLAHRPGVEPGALDQHVAGPRTDLAVLAAHDAGQGHRPRAVGDHQHVVGELALGAVQGGQDLARVRRADDDGRGRAVRDGADLVEVEAVERLAHLPQHVVGDVDHVVDRAQADGSGAAGPASRATGRR